MVTMQQSANLGNYEAIVHAALADLTTRDVPSRIWAGDHIVWQEDPREAANRLGWLHVAEELRAEAPGLRQFAEDARAAGFTHALLLGMGGSSLAPEVFSTTLGGAGLALAVLDSTDPEAVLAWADRLDLAHTLFIVSTKSGGTIETFSFFKYFYNRVAAAVGVERAGAHFIAITDPGSGLADAAARYHFRATFLANPNIGGRYSALSHFGIVPAALAGVDIHTLLNRALAAAHDDHPASHPAIWLGAALGELAKAGRDKATFVLSPAIAPFGAWVEQLVAESLGKQGHGILPVVGEELLSPAVYGADRVFIHLRLHDDESADAALAALEAAGHPVIRLHLHDAYDLGGQCFTWELAVAVAGERLGVNPFDQPNVEAAKEVARAAVAAYQREGRLPALTPTLSEAGVTAFADQSAATLRDLLTAFLARGEPNVSYVALQAYLPPTPATDAALHALRTALQRRTRLATTVGYGPRFLHSTGQLHKGDAGHGLFLQLTHEPARDAPIPDEAGVDASAISFAVLLAAQAHGDRQALLDNGRAVLRLDLGSDVAGGLARVAEWLA